MDGMITSVETTAPVIKGYIVFTSAYIPPQNLTGAPGFLAIKKLKHNKSETGRNSYMDI